MELASNDTTTGNFWSGFNAAQLLDLGAKTFTTNSQTDVAAKNASAAAKNAQANQMKAATWAKWLPIGIGILVLGVVGIFLFRRRG